MLKKQENTGQLSFYTTFEELLDHHHPLYILSNQIHWKLFEETFRKHYTENFGRPAIPIRRMVALLMLKHIRNLSDESVVEQWSENSYYQYFSGEKLFNREAPCEASELVHFRQRIGEEGIELILKESIRVNGKDGTQDKASVDTTVQEKNITYPTDNKLHRKIINKCLAIADKEGLELRQSYRRTLKRLGVDQRFRNHPKSYRKALKADRKVKTIAGRLVRELERKLQAGAHATELAMFTKVLAQKRKDSNKIYSLHEPEVRCIAKGKEHKKYEFGSKVSITITQGTNVIIGALNIPDNDYDGHTLEAVLNQQERLTGHQLKEVYVDRGYKGVKLIHETLIHSPKTFSSKLSRYKRTKLKKGFTNRAAIEPRIGHLKTDHRLSKNFYKGIQGDTINVMLAAAAMNFKRMMNIWKVNPIFCLFRFLSRIIFQNSPSKYIFHDKAFT